MFSANMAPGGNFPLESGRIYLFRFIQTSPLMRTTVGNAVAARTVGQGLQIIPKSSAKPRDT